VHHIHIPVRADRRGHRPVAAHVLQHCGRRARLPLDGRVLRGLRVPAEQDRRHQHGEQHAQGDEERGQPGEQPDDHQDHQDAESAADDDRYRLRVGLAYQPGDHAHLLQPPGVRQVLGGIPRQSRVSGPSLP
jgi:hypothetical protein